MEAVVYRNKSVAVARVIVKSILVDMTQETSESKRVGHRSVISIVARDMPHHRIYPQKRQRKKVTTSSLFIYKKYYRGDNVTFLQKCETVCAHKLQQPN
jgi:hypothetical protein